VESIFGLEEVLEESQSMEITLEEFHKFREEQSKGRLNYGGVIRYYSSPLVYALEFVFC
jgi:hypothetical protein